MSSVRLSNIGKKCQNIVDANFQVDHGAGITTLNKIFKMLVLLNEFFLHVVPHNLEKTAAISCYFWSPKIPVRFVMNYPLTPRVKTRVIQSFLTSDSMNRTLKCDHSLESC